jgi:membrane protein DedA with SNARE-associated domain
MDVVAILGLAGLILAKEAGVPLPVPGDLVIIGAGATVAGNLPGAGLVLAVILVAGFIGASVQFFLFSGALRRPLLAALARLGVGEDRLRGLSERFRTTGVRAVALARMTPGVRIAVIPAAAIATIPFLVFLPGVVAGNSVFVTAHFGLGFVLGNYAQDLVERASGTAILVGLLVVLAAGGWFVLRRRSVDPKRDDTYECWTDCSCPVCLAIVARPSRHQPVS